MRTGSLVWQSVVSWPITWQWWHLIDHHECGGCRGTVMVHAQSRSFQRTIIGQLRRSLQWWPTHHCSVPPLPPATLVGLISELHWNTSSTPIPPTNLHSYHCHYQPTPCAIYRSTTRAPPRSTHVLLRHSFYFHFYFEHLNFTWSYLIDMKISWSLDHISWSYLGDLISWSTILSWSLDLIIWWWSIFIWTLHYYLHAFDMPLTHVFHWRSTCILHMLLCNMLLCFYLTLDMLWTHTLHVFTLRTTHGH